MKNNKKIFEKRFYKTLTYFIYFIKRFKYPVIVI